MIYYRRPGPLFLNNYYKYIIKKLYIATVFRRRINKNVPKISYFGDFIKQNEYLVTFRAVCVIISKTILRGHIQWTKYTESNFSIQKNKKSNR